VSAVFAIASDTLRQARAAEAAHLDAVLKVNGAKALRLANLLERLQSPDIKLADDIELKASPGEEPHVWLDLSHRITMEPDAKTYRLSHFSTNRIDVLLETESLDEMLAATHRVLAHRSVKQDWSNEESSLTPKVWSAATLLYVWTTGVIAGAAGLALLSTYLKKLPF
jgi:hypothetical protein